MKNTTVGYFRRKWQKYRPADQVAPFGERIYAKVSFLMVGSMFISRCLCLCPVVIKRDVNKEDGRTTWKIAYSWKWNVFNSLLSVFYASFGLFGVIQSVKLSYIQNGPLSPTKMYLVIINACILTVFCSICIVRCGAHVKDLIAALRMIEKADTLVSWTHHKREPNKKFRSLAVLLFLYWILLYILKVYPQDLVNNLHYQSIFDLNVLIAMYFSLYLYGVMMIILLSSFIYILKEKLDMVNDALRLLGRDMNAPKWIYGKSGIVCVKTEIKEFYPYTIEGSDDIPVKSTTPINKNENYKNDVSCKLAPINFDFGDFRTKISAALRAREFLGKAARILDSSFGLIQLAFFSTIPMQIVVAVYSVISGLENSEGLEALIINVLWSIGHIIKALFLVECCHIISKTAKETENIVTKAMAITYDKAIREDLKIFLELLKQCPIIFSCMDVRVIDRGVLSDLSGAVVTLLVILVQYGK